MSFKTYIVAALAATGVIAAPLNERTQRFDIQVTLTGPQGVRPWTVGGFQENVAGSFSSSRNPGPFSQVKLSFSTDIKNASPGIENRYRCALEDENGNRIITTRGNNTEFTFGDNNNPKPWTLENGPFKNVKVTCDPTFTKFGLDGELIQIALRGDSELARNVYFNPSQVAAPVSQRVGGVFRTAQLILGPKVANQKLRCQLTGPDGQVILLDRGANTNKKTFGDAGKGAWTLDVAGDGAAAVSTVTCDPSFV